VARILVLYATRYGSTAKIAARLSEDLRCRGHDVSLVDIKSGAPVGDLGIYDVACIGAAVYSFRGYPRAIVRFARRNRAWLERTASAFVSVGLVIAGSTDDGRAEAQATLDRFMAKTGWRPAHVTFVAGDLPYSRYDVMTRRAMRRAAARYGGDTDTSRDYTYTDWDQVDRFAHEITAVFDRLATSSDARRAPVARMPNNGIQTDNTPRVR
jgi:menaquinone-dependent protoporphyrinogen oxidase